LSLSPEEGMPKMNKIMIWLKAARLKLHILGMLPVLIGSLIALQKRGIFRVSNFILSELITLFVLIATAFANDYADAETDKLNKTFNDFSGGSRVIPSGLISKKQMLTGAIVSSLISITFSLIFIVLLRGHPAILILNLFGLFIGIEYSLPPLQINYRGLGELFVVFMYSFFCLYFGYMTQRGPELDINGLFLSIPLAISMFLMILITEVPDTESDRMSGKKTIPTIFGRESSFLIYSLGIVTLYLTIFILFFTDTIGKRTVYSLLLSLPLGFYSVIISTSRKKTSPKNISLLCILTLLLNVWINIALSINLAIS
jgi:1,4-dihydroxy-2-naphthoate octaprenyltransferase